MMTFTSPDDAVTAGILVAIALVFLAAAGTLAVLVRWSEPVISTRPAQPEPATDDDTQVLELPKQPEQPEAPYRARHAAGADHD